MTVWHILIGAGLLVALGVSFELIGAFWSRQRYKTPPGKLVDIGTHRLHMNIMGTTHENKPTIVLDAGVGSNSLDWQLVQPKIAEFAQVVSYDRAGYAWSDIGEQPRTPERIADELHTLLHKAELQPPYILVGHSFGGIYIRVFQQKYPDEVAGMMLVDASHPVALAEQDTDAELRRLRNVGIFKRLGILRLVIGRVMYRADKLNADKRKQYLAFVLLDSNNVPREARPLFHDGVDLPDTIEGIPFTVISRATDLAFKDDKKWHDYQQQLVALSSNAQHITTERSSHYIAFAEPETVVNALRDMVETVMQKV